MLRIYGNRQLKTLPGKQTRPTSARVREAIFNIWQFAFVGCRWLDLCTGTGSMGAEALCRGASIVVGIEKSQSACGIITQNWQKVATSEQEWKLLQGDILQQLPKLSKQQFDLIYFDPPYASELYQPVLEAIVRYQLLDMNGEMAVEHNPKLWTPPEIPELEICRQKVYGSTALNFYSLDRSGAINRRSVN
jgi:16S rRNA (guanine(966)-N(2))-methyltransferase RsmD